VVLKAQIGDKVTRDFSQWSEAFGEEFCARLAAAYEDEYQHARPQSERSYWFRGKRFLDFFADSDQAEVQALRGYYREQWVHDPCPPKSIRIRYSSLLASYRQHVKNNIQNGKSRINLVSGCNAILKLCADAGLLPHNLKVTGWKSIDRIGQGSTFLDVTMVDDSDLKTFISQADEIIGEEFSQDNDSQSELRKLLANILIEAQTLEEEPDIVASSILVLSKRIKLIKTACAKILVDHIEARQIVKLWIADSDIRRRAFLLKEVMDSEEGAIYKRDGYLIALGDDPKSVLVCFCHLFFSHRFPLESNPYYDLLAKRLRAYHIEISEIRYLLGYDAKVLAAGLAFICFEVAGNPESLIELDIDALERTAAGYLLKWVKYRKGVKAHESQIVSYRDPDSELNQDTLSVVDVFMHLKAITEPLRDDVDESSRSKLLIAHHKNHNKASEYYRPDRIGLAALNRHFKVICEEASGSKWVSTLKAIRGSELLLEGLVSRDAMAVASKGRHTSHQMPAKYTYHIPEMLRRESNIREFLAWFETLLTLDIEGFADKVGIDPKEYAKRAQEIANNQFGGIHCADPRAGVQPGTEEGEVCHRVDKCPTCEMRRGIFVISESNLVSLLHWHTVLEDAKRKLAEEEYGRWALWHVFTSLMLAKIEKLPQHSMLLERSQELQKRQSNPYVELIPALNVTEMVEV